MNWYISFEWTVKFRQLSVFPFLILLCAHTLQLSLQTLTGFASFKGAGPPLPEEVVEG